MEIPDNNNKTYAYSTDVQSHKGERVTFKSPTGYTYTKNVLQSSKPLREFTEKEKDRLRRKKFEKFYHDPIVDGDYRPIPHTPEEIQDFHKAIDGGGIYDMLKERPKYLAKRPEPNQPDPMNYEPDGHPEAEIFDPATSALPDDSLNDPYYLMRGRFKILLKEHRYTQAVNIIFSPLMYLPLKDRVPVTLTFIRNQFNLAGVKCVSEGDPLQKLLLMECRFMDVEQQQDELDRETAKLKRDDLINVTPDILDSVIEDFLRLNCILYPTAEKDLYKLYTFFYSA